MSLKFTDFFKEEKEGEPTHDGNQMEDEPRQKKRSLLQLDGQHEQQIDQDADGRKNAENYDNEQVQFSLI